MIYESSYWKDDLLKLASSVERRLIQTRWAEKNFYTLEKEIFIGFYSVRKLIESKKVSDHVSGKQFELKEFQYRGNPESIFSTIKDTDYDLNSGKPVMLTVHKICNQLIHSHHFVPFLPNGKTLIGFYFCSDRQRTTGIYQMTLFDVVKIYRLVGSNYPHTVRRSRRPTGRIVTTIE